MNHALPAPSRSLLASLLLAAMLAGSGGVALILHGCGADTAAFGSSAEFKSGPDDLPTTGSAGVVVPGAADFARFRELLTDGKIPDPEVLDDLGFFAEHKLDFPPASCGEALCVHGRVGIMANLITGSACTVAQLGMNSPIDPASLPRPKLHLVIVADTSAPMAGVAIAKVREGLTRLSEVLDQSYPDDRVTLVDMAQDVTVTYSGAVGANKLAFDGAVAGLKTHSGEASNLYGGLSFALAQAKATGDKAMARRIIVVGSGAANIGIQSDAKIEALATAAAAEGVQITTVAVGKDAAVARMARIAELGQGTAYFLENAAAVKEVFVDEALTAFFPLAKQVEIAVAAGGKWAIRGIYGVRGAVISVDQLHVTIPALYLARRLSAAAPIDGGRRGGGGVIQVELMPLAVNFDTPGLSDVGTLTMQWVDASSGSGKAHAQALTLPTLSQAAVQKGLFKDFTAEKGFVMLNLYVGMKMATGLVRDGDPGAASALLAGLGKATQAWLAEAKTPDPDIEDDLKWLGMLQTLIEKLPAELQTPAVPPPEPWPMD